MQCGWSVGEEKRDDDEEDEEDELTRWSLDPQTSFSLLVTA